MKLSAQHEVQHHNTLLNADRAALDELLDLLRTERTTGKLVVSFNQGGITSVTVEERTRVTERELDEWDAWRHGGANGANGNALATRGAVRVLYDADGA